MTRAVSAVGYPNPANSSSHDCSVLMLRNGTPTLLTQPVADSHQYALYSSDRVRDGITPLGDSEARCKNGYRGSLAPERRCCKLTFRWCYPSQIPEPRGPFP